MAIDDLVVEYGMCPSFGSCAFEDNELCFWQNVLDSRDEFDWSFGQHQTQTPDTGPDSDHTFGDSYGTYLYVDTNSPEQTGYRAMLESTLFLPTPSYGLCMDFWYHMYGDKMGSLNIYINSFNSTSLLWTQHGNKGPQWLNAQLTVRSALPFRIYIEAVRGTSITSDMAIDDVDFIEKSCNLQPQDASPDNQVTIPIVTTTRTLRPTSEYDCTFETDYCIWSQSPESTFNWWRVQGKYGSILAGPIEYDHTYGLTESWYLFADVTDKKYSDLARIESADLTGTRCLEFYYYFFSLPRYQFNVYVKVGDQLGLPLWSRDSSNANFWRLGRLTVRSGRSYRIVFELTDIQNAAANELFGLDDVFISDGECADTSDVNGICTFTDGDFCGYNVTTGGNNFQWLIYTPDAPDFFSQREAPLPIFDHTSEAYSSGYMYVLSKGFKVNDTTSLVSREYEPFSESNPKDATRCLEFYYYMQETNAITLNVKTITTESSIVNTLWSRNYDHGKFWWKGSVNVKLIVNYGVAFEAVVGANSENGIVALDDVGLRNGACSR